MLIVFIFSFHYCRHAYFSLGRYSEAASAYEKAVELDPSNASLKSSLSTARSRASEGDSSSSSRDVGASSPPPAAASNPFAGLGGLGGGAGGMPDLGSLLNNPQMMQMAQQMMAVSCKVLPGLLDGSLDSRYPTDTPLSCPSE
jgi:small glutamine-rich tetratricopeptide repeat-containing protein alpha